MNNQNKKKIAIIFIFLVCIGGTVVLTSMLGTQGGNIETHPTLPEIAILHDDSDDVTTAASELFVQLIDVSNVEINVIAISTIVDLSNQLGMLSSSNQAIILIGHGTDMEFIINDNGISWKELQDKLLPLNISKNIILACNSSGILTDLDKTSKEKFYTFNHTVDYQVASHEGAMHLAEFLENEEMIYKVHYFASMDIENLIIRTIDIPQPLWKGHTHNSLAEIAREDFCNYSLISILESEVYRLMVDSRIADNVFRFSSQGEMIKEILFNATFRAIWLQHGYGVRFGFTIRLGLIPIYTVPAFFGNVHEAAQYAYDQAVQAYRNKEFVNAGKWLAHAAHYIQDATMPYHVYDLFVTNTYAIRLFNLVKLIQDILCLTLHNKGEAWVDDNLNELNGQIYSYANSFKHDFTSEEPDFLETEVEALAKWTRTFTLESIVGGIVLSDSDQHKIDLFAPYLGKAVAYTAALYERFAQDVCRPPKTPDAPISQDAEGNIDTAYSFNFVSTDPDGDEIRYQMDWGDGTTEFTDYYRSGMTVSLTHEWTTPGIYSIRVRAQDEFGHYSPYSEYTTFSVYNGTVNNRPDRPTELLGTSTGETNELIEFSFRGTDINNDQISYHILWDDGQEIMTSLYDSGVSVSLSHSWSTEGLKLIKVQTQDEHGLVSDWATIAFEVLESEPNSSPSQPNVPSGNSQGYTGIEYTFLVETTDPNGDQIQYEMDWGDGTTTTSLYVISGTTESLSHTWNTIGTYYVKVRARDEHGAWSEWSPSMSIEIIEQSSNSAPITPDPPSGPLSGYINEDYTYSVVTVDLDGDTIRYQIDWGDGTTTTSSYFSSGTTVSLTHRWSTEGVYTLRVRAQDEHGEWSDWSSVITIVMSEFVIEP